MLRLGQLSLLESLLLELAVFFHVVPCDVEERVYSVAHGRVCSAAVVLICLCLQAPFDTQLECLFEMMFPLPCCFMDRTRIWFSEDLGLSGCGAASLNWQWLE